MNFDWASQTLQGIFKVYKTKQLNGFTSLPLIHVSCHAPNGHLPHSLHSLAATAEGSFLESVGVAALPALPSGFRIVRVSPVHLHCTRLKLSPCFPKRVPPPPSHTHTLPPTYPVRWRWQSTLLRPAQR
jgi:hypothetical protein